MFETQKNLNKKKKSIFKGMVLCYMIVSNVIFCLIFFILILFFPLGCYLPYSQKKKLLEKLFERISPLEGIKFKEEERLLKIGGWDYHKLLRLNPNRYILRYSDTSFGGLERGLVIFRTRFSEKSVKRLGKGSYLHCFTFSVLDVSLKYIGFIDLDFYSNSFDCSEIIPPEICNAREIKEFIFCLSYEEFSKQALKRFNILYFISFGRMIGDREENLFSINNDEERKNFFYLRFDGAEEQRFSSAKKALIYPDSQQEKIFLVLKKVWFGSCCLFKREVLFLPIEKPSKKSFY